MNEKNLAKTIKDHINEDIPLDVFVNFWFQGKKFRDDELTSKLLEFSKQNNFDYLVVLGKPPKIRFWRLKDTELLTKGE